MQYLSGFDSLSESSYNDLLFRRFQHVKTGLVIEQICSSTSTQWKFNGGFYSLKDLIAVLNKIELHN